MNKTISYTRMCSKCRKLSIEPAIIPHVAEVKYEGKVHSVEIPSLHVGKCTECRHILFDLQTDAEIDAAFRRQQKILTAEQILAGRKRLKLKQEVLAQKLGTARATISRWEKRRLVPSRAMDSKLRAYFHSKAFRDLLDQIELDSSIGVIVNDDVGVVCSKDLSSTPIKKPSTFVEIDEDRPKLVNRITRYLHPLDTSTEEYFEAVRHQGSFFRLMGGR
jgi:putative zinc finger/helix-turn-helix YgiT family protein